MFDNFTGLKEPRDITGYTLFRGTTDFSQLKQFDLYESGYPYLILVSIPEFIRKMYEKGDKVTQSIIRNYCHIIEYEFKGFGSGLPDIAGETSSISNGFQDINVITKVSGDTATTFSMNYNEKAGSPITKMHELYLRSVRDPGTGFKTYNGLIGLDPTSDIPANEAGFHKECFSFLYIHTDNTGLMVERAAYLVGCMPTTSQISIYNGTKGDVQFQEISVEYTGFPIQGKLINDRAAEILNWMNNESNNMCVRRNSWNYEYAALKTTANDAEAGQLHAPHLTSESTLFPSVNP